MCSYCRRLAKRLLKGCDNLYNRPLHEPSRQHSTGRLKNDNYKCSISAVGKGQNLLNDQESRARRRFFFALTLLHYTIVETK